MRIIKPALVLLTITLAVIALAINYWVHRGYQRIQLKEFDRVVLFGKGYPEVKGLIPALPEEVVLIDGAESLSSDATEWFDFLNAPPTGMTWIDGGGIPQGFIDYSIAPFNIWLRIKPGLEFRLKEGKDWDYESRYDPSIWLVVVEE